jgi:hypothetical protein
MRLVFGFVAAFVICAGWMVCPSSLRDQVAQAVAPDDETISEMRAGAEVILAALSVQAPDLDETEDGRGAPVQ